MTQHTPLSRADLFQILKRHFDEEELRTLCFELDLDYDDLRGEGKEAKARELVTRFDRRNRLAVLEAAVRRSRGTTYSYERVQELQESILNTSQSDVRDAFVEFTQQIDAYLDAFNLLHEQLSEWKEVHNLLQNLQNNFAPCRSYIYTIARLGSHSEQSHQEKLLFEVEVEWRPCKRAVRKLEVFASSVQVIAEPYESESGSGADWLIVPREISRKIDKALFDDDAVTLAEYLSDFGDRVDQFLYLADKALRDLVGRINQLPRPGSPTTRS